MHYYLHNIRKVVFLLTYLVFGAHLYAQKFTAQVSKNRVQVGEGFQIAFTLNTNGSNFKAPAELKEFDVYSGPNQSSSMQFINGDVSQTITLSYVIAARKEGKYTFGPASITANGQKLESNSITIEVTKASGNQQSSSQGSGSQQSGQGDQATTKVSGEDLFIRTSVSKTNCYMGEQIVVTQKVYSRVDLRGFNNVKPPSYNGFWSQQEETNRQVQLQVENLDGINYYVAEYGKTFLFPQRSGSITIDPMELDCIVRKQSSKKPRTVFEQFFGGGYEDVVVKVKSKPLKIEVIPLPETNKPSNFTGAVGSFSYKAEVNKETTKANEAINLKITITGKGNIKLVEPLTLNLPESFESYDPKTNESISTTGGVSGTKTYEYTIIPRESGEFKLDNLGFSYFDISKKQYVSMPSPEITINVLPGDPNSATSAQVYNQKQDVKETENDIRYIKKGDLNLYKQNTEFFGSWLHYIILLSSLLIFTGGLIYRKQSIAKNSDTAAVKERKAAKVARKQLVIAEKLMNENKKEAFYTELLRAVNTYIGNKLNIAVSDLNRTTIHTQLLAKNVSSDSIHKLITTLDVCEFAKYAPGNATNDLKTVYTDVATIITSIENEIKV